ncbi:nitrite reductase (NAD(P)H), partial [Cupriavidus basilensis]
MVSDCGKYLLGGVLVGDASEYGTLLQMMLNKIELPESPEFPILPDSSGKAVPALGADALPDTAQIRSCNNVSKGEICSAVCDGAISIGALKTCTKAGTAQAAALPVTQIMKAEMKKQGMAVNNHLCEHFPYSRQELCFTRVRVGKFKSFDALLAAAHGNGMAAHLQADRGSILASVLE